MRDDITTPLTTSYRKRNITVTIYPTTQSPTAVLAGTATGGVDYSSYVEKISQNSTGAVLTLSIPSTVAKPGYGQCVSIKDTGSLVGTETVFNGVVETSNRNSARGTNKEISVTVRRRDAFDLWRTTRRVSQAFRVGVDLSTVAISIASYTAGLATTDYDITTFGVISGSATQQLTDQTLWEMLETVGIPAMLSPFVDARGKLKFISRDVRREPTYSWDDDSAIVDIREMSARPQLTAMRVKYTDPALVKVQQAERVLGTRNMTCGMMRYETIQDIYWSEDHTQRAENTRLETVQDINDGWIPIGDVSYSQIDVFHGRIQVRASIVWNTAYFFATVGAITAAIAIPDPVVVTGIGISGGVTVPSPWKILALNTAIIFLVNCITRIGTGVYNIRGVPYDYVQEVKEVLAYDEDAPSHVEKIEELESSLIPNSDVANNVAVSELLHRAKQSNTIEMDVIDDYRFEPGDIFEFVTAGQTRRVYCEDVARELMRDASAGAAIATIRGFFIA